MTGLIYLTRALVIIGALNWGLVAVAEFDLVAEIFGLVFGEVNVATRIVYGLVAIAGLFELVRLFTGPNPQPATTANRESVGAERYER
jgi:uncharacterized protein